MTAGSWNLPVIHAQVVNIGSICSRSWLLLLAAWRQYRNVHPTDPNKCSANIKTTPNIVKLVWWTLLSVNQLSHVKCTYYHFHEHKRLHNELGQFRQYSSDYILDEGGSIPGRGQDFFSSPSSLCVQTSSETHQASYPIGTGGPFLGSEAQLGSNPDRSPLATVEVKNE